MHNSDQPDKRGILQYIILFFIVGIVLSGSFWLATTMLSYIKQDYDQKEVRKEELYDKLNKTITDNDNKFKVLHIFHDRNWKTFVLEGIMTKERIRIWSGNDFIIPGDIKQIYIDNLYYRFKE